MTWQDGPVTVHVGDALVILHDLPAESDQCVVTSPPYWGLRDYGIPGQFGLEPTPELYVERMVEVFREVRRVLRPDGTLWLNLGDSYATDPHGPNGDDKSGLSPSGVRHQRRNGRLLTAKAASGLTGIKPKDLVGIPWRLAFALQADGWWLRSDIVWSKPNPMPESVTDRPTKAHEYVFLLTKSARYFYDAEAVREEPAQWYGDRPVDYIGKGFNWTKENGGIRTKDKWSNPAGRNLRSVWTIATQPYPEAHFATFPEELARRCIAAGTSERGCCPECGAPWARVVSETTEYADFKMRMKAQDYSMVREGQRGGRTNPATVPPKALTTGWQPTCTHNGEPVPCTVLDPFAGSGTTLAMARRMGRRAVGIELQADYLPLIQRRVSEAALPLLES